MEGGRKEAYYGSLSLRMQEGKKEPKMLQHTLAVPAEFFANRTEFC